MANEEKNQDPIASSLSSSLSWTQLDRDKASDSYLDEQKKRTEWSIDQAVTRGLISEENAEEAKVNNQRTWWDKAWGFQEASGNLLGEVAQPLVDVLSLGNYAAAAATKATINDPLIQIGSMKVGFTPSSWKREFNKRPIYGDMMESFGAGLAFDIAMDPMTYLSFGVSAGMKVGVKGVAKVGAKNIPEGANFLTLTKHGQDIYQVAARRQGKLIKSLLERESEDALAAGIDVARTIEPETMARLHQEIARSMIDDYAELSMELQETAGRWQSFKNKANPAKLDLFGVNAEDMFRETASLQQRDLGLDWRKAGGFLTDENHKLGQYLKEVAPSFHRKFNVPVDIQNKWFVTKGEIEQQTSKLVGEIEESMKGLTPEQNRNATLVLAAEEDRLIRSFGNDQQNIVGSLAQKDGSVLLIDEDTMRAVEFGKARFDMIVEAENLAGFKIDKIENYVERVYKTPALRALVVDKLQGAQSLSILSQVSVKPSFRMHRAIASLDEAISQVGEEAIEMNLGKLLARRQAQSIRMMEMEKFYDYLKLTAGITPTLVYQINKEGKRVAVALKELLKSTGDQRILGADQVWARDKSYHLKAGFSEGGEVGHEVAESKIELLEYLGKTLGERQELASAGGSSIKPNSFAEVTKQHDWSFSASSKGAKEQNPFNAVDVVRAEYEDILGTDITDHIAKSAGVKKSAITPSQTKKFIIALDKKFKDELGAGINDLFPDFVERVVARAERGHLGKNLPRSRRVLEGVDGGRSGVRTRELRAPSQRQFKELREKLAEKVPSSEKYVPQIPKELSLRGQIARMRYGNFTDISKPSREQFDRISVHANDLGLAPEQLLDITEALLGKTSLSEMSARGASKLEEFLMMHLGKFQAVEGAQSSALFNSQSRKIKTGSVGRPSFPKASQDVQSSIEAYEKMSHKQIKRSQRLKGNERKADQLKKKLAAFEKRRDEAVKLLNNAKKNPKGKKDLARRADNLKKWEDRISAEKLKIEKNAEIKANLPIEKFDLPEITPDKRAFISSKDILLRNAEKLAPHESRIFVQKTGAARIDIKIRDITEGASDKASRAKKALNKTIEPVEEELKELAAKWSKLIEEGVDPDSAPIVALVNDMKAGQQIIDDATKAAGEAFIKESDGIRILPDGRYVDKDGKIRDVIVSRPAKGKPKILGEDADEIRAALVEHAFTTGGNAKVLQPSLAKEVPDTIIGSAGGEYIMPAPVVRFIEDVLTPLYRGENKMIDGFLKGFDRVQNAFKVPLLAPWMSTFARNAIGNVSLVYLKAGLSIMEPETLKTWNRVYEYTLATESAAYAKMRRGLNSNFDDEIKALGAKKISTPGGDFTIDEIKQEFGRRGVFSSWQRSEIFDVVSNQKLKGAGAGAVVGGSLGGPVGGLVGAGVGALLGKEAYRMKNLFRAQELGSEMPTRLILGITELRRTGSMDQAANSVRKYLHDYSELSTFERRFVRRAIPFYNFTKLATRVFAEEIIENPGRVTLPMKIFNDANATAVFGGSAALPEDVPDWFHKQMVFMGKDIDEETGQVKSWVTGGMNLPLQEVLQLADIVGPGGAKGAQMFSRTSFLPTSALEYIFNYDTFRGGAIYPDVKAGIKKTTHQSGNAFKQSPEWMKTLVQFEVGEDGQARVNPKIAWMLGEIPTSRFVNVAKKIWDSPEEEAGKFNMNHLASSIFGVNKYSYDADQMQYFVNKNRVDAMTQVLSNLKLLKSWEIDRATFKQQLSKDRSAGQYTAMSSLLNQEGLKGE